MALRKELCSVVEPELLADHTVLFELVEHPVPSLKIADLGVVYVQTESGSYSLRETGASTNVIVTTSKERLLDYVIGMLAAARHKIVPFTPAFAVRLLIGETLADVESHLILNTLRVFNGNHRRTCRSLGVSEQELRLKLESILGPHSLRTFS